MIALASATLAALWLPAGAPDMAALEALLARRPELRLAVAVAPEDLPAASTAALSRLWAEGRVEPVLRLPGDPILPFAPATRRDLRPLLTLGRRAFHRALGRPPEGFAPGGGAIDDADAKILGALGFTWAAVSLPRADTLEGLDAAAAPPPLESWRAAPGRQRVINGLEEAALALTRYQNSGMAQLEVLDSASSLLRKLESSRYLADPVGTQTEFDAGLTEVYVLLGQRPPDELVASTGAFSAAGLVALEAGPGRLAFVNALPPPSAVSRPCTIERLDVAFDTAAVSFAVTLASSAWPEGGTVEVYVDINHRPGAGSQSLLPWTGGFLRAADSWEFALSLSTEGAVLFRGQTSETFPALWDGGARRATASLPASRAKGKPGSWGYFAACSCARKDAPCALQPDRRAWSVLGSRAEQRQLDEKKARQPRFSAQRLDPGRAAATRLTR